MGKAVIIENLENAQYKIGLVYDKIGLQDKVDALDARIAGLTAEIASTEEGTAKEMLKLRLLSIEKTKTKYNNLLIADNPEYTVYCADFMDGLTGNVGTIELIGDPDKYLQIKPGYSDSAAYDSVADGQLAYTDGLTSACNFYNYAMKIGWQKWMPEYRYGTITSITSDLCDVTLESCYEGSNDLNVNASYTDVTISYMDSNGEPFKIGDEVLIKLTDWDTPLVVGFKVPRRSSPLVLLILAYPDKTDYCMVWDTAEDALCETVPLNAGGFATFPCAKSLISDWIDDTKDVGNNLWNVTTKGFDEGWTDYECVPPINDACIKETIHINECPGISGEELEDSIYYKRAITSTMWGNRYDDTFYWLPSEIQAYLPDASESFNFDSTKIQAINGSGYIGSMLTNLYHLKYDYYIYSYGYSWYYYFHSRKYTIKTPLGNFEELATNSFTIDSGVGPVTQDDVHLDPLYGDLTGKFSKNLFAQIYWIQYQYSGDTETNRTISVIAQSEVVEDSTTVSPKNALGRSTLLEGAIVNFINSWYIDNSYGDRDIVDCNLSLSLVV